MIRRRSGAGARKTAVRIGVAALLAALAILAFSPLPGSVALPSGIAESKEGCICHAGGQTNEVQAILEGKPVTDRKYEPGKDYDLVVKAEGGVPAAGQANLGGFALTATLGEFTPADDTTQILEAAGGRKDIVHTDKGNDQRNWTVKWKAPAEDTEIVFYLAVNTVNGNAGSPEGGTTGDKWNTATFTVGEAKAKAPVPWDWILLVGMPGVLFVLIVAVYLVNSSHRSAEEE